MKIYLTIKSIPELSGLPKDIRLSSWCACFWKAFQHWQAWLAMFVTITTWTSVPFIRVYVCDEVSAIISWSVIGIVCFGGQLLIFQAVIQQMRPHLKRFVESHRESGVIKP